MGILRFFSSPDPRGWGIGILMVHSNPDPWGGGVDGGTEGLF